MPHISLKVKFSVIDKWQWCSVPGSTINHLLLKMVSGCFWKYLGLNCTTPCVLFKSPQLKDIHQKLVTTPHNYEMLIFCSEEDGRNIFWTTHNSGSLWKNPCYRTKSLLLRKRYSKAHKMLSLAFLNALSAGFPPLLSTTLSLFYYHLIKSHQKNRIKLILWTHNWAYE